MLFQVNRLVGRLSPVVFKLTRFVVFIEPMCTIKGNDVVSIYRLPAALVPSFGDFWKLESF